MRPVQGDEARVLRRIAVSGVTFLSWARDDRHLAYRLGGTLFVLDVKTGTVHAIERLGRELIHGATWDPWSRVIALSMTAAGGAASQSSVVLANIDGTASRPLPLPFTGASRIDWSPWRGETIGITRRTAHGTQAWVALLPQLPPDPAERIGG